MKLIFPLSILLLAADQFNAEALSFRMATFRKGLGLGRGRRPDLPKSTYEDIAIIMTNQDQSMTSDVIKNDTEGASIPNEIFNLVKVSDALSDMDC